MASGLWLSVSVESLGLIGQGSWFLPHGLGLKVPGSRSRLYGPGFGIRGFDIRVLNS